MMSQPKGFFLLFLAELSERYGFYAVLFLIVPYAIDQLDYSNIEASLLFGTYTALVYSTTAAGGIIADRLLGHLATMLTGLAIMASGSLLLTFGATQTVLLGLAALLVGTGYFKPSVSSLLGLLYSKDDPRRDPGYTLFYMGTNIGSATAALVSGFVVQDFGFHLAFLIAFLGKCLAIAALLLGRHVLKEKGGVPGDRKLLQATVARVPLLVWLAAGTLGFVVIGTILLSFTIVAGEIIAIFFVAIFGYFLFVVRRLETEYRRRAVVMLIVFAFGLVFWAVYNQDANTILLFIRQSVDRDIFGISIPAVSFMSVNPLIVVAGAPIMSLLWFRLSTRGIALSDSGRFAVGLLLLAFAYFVLSAALAGSSGFVAPAWVLLFYVFFSFGELCVGPIGLSMVSRLAKKELMGLCMGMWFMVDALGSYIGSLLALITLPPAGADLAEETAIRQTAFFEFGLIALGAAIVLILLMPFIARMNRKGASKV